MPGDKTGNAPIYQLRIYEVAPDKRAHFYERFEKHALPIMQRYGFRPFVAWESRSVTDFEFIYLVEWPDTDSMERRWKAFLADPEWVEIKRRTAEDVGEPVQRVTERVLDAVSCLPAFDSSGLADRSRVDKPRG